MPKFLEYARLLTIGPKKAIPKRKRQVLKKAEKEIDRLDRMKTARTKAVERANTGVPSDIEKRKKEVARRARKTLMGKKGK